MVVLAGGCTVGSRPNVSVLGVSQPAHGQGLEDRSSLTLFVEVTNPTSRDLRLSRLEYQLSASSWFETEGRIALERAVAAGTSTVVEIPVPLRSDATTGGVPYVLRGRLVALENRIERSWKVEATGALVTDEGGHVAARPARIQVAGTGQ